jgi:Tfp pilus assembly protein PilF
VLIGVLKRLLRSRPDETRRPSPAPAPEDLDALLREATALEQAGRSTEALSLLETAVSVAPHSAEARYRLGTLHAREDRMEPALTLFQEALALDPAHVGALSNLGNVHAAHGLLNEACAAYRQAVGLVPGAPEPWHNYASALRELGDDAGAVTAFDRALAIRPDEVEARFSRALALLGAGDLPRGWRAHESRFEVPRLRVHRRDFPQPLWRGEPLGGRTLLVWGEQGVGDEILFASMFAELANLGGRIVVECRAKLVSLFARSFPQFEVVALRDPPDVRCLRGVDLQIAAGSLGQYLRPDLASFPERPAFLHADQQRVAHWRERLAGLGPGLKVGLCWRSTKMKGERALKWTRLDQWDALLAVPGVHWISLQYDDCEAELQAARARSGVPLWRYPEVDYFDDLDEAGALTRALDLVISMPTAVCMQSAALGVPTWQLAYGADWRPLGTDRLPWLPCVVRYRRPPDRSWPDMLAVVARDLACTVHEREIT